MAMGYDLNQLERLAPVLTFVEALTKPELLKATLEELKSENVKYQELLGAANTKKLAEDAAHKVLDKAEADARAVRETSAKLKMEADERQAKLDEREAALSEHRSSLSALELSLKEREALVEKREVALVAAENKQAQVSKRQSELEDKLKAQALELAEKAEKIKALVG